ncbi:type VI secretion system-associated FHA domain protein TagH [Glaciimonas soli]|nr:type VI secretion system-associated FHA domain protein TagH [Glaciimonas soli]
MIKISVISYNGITPPISLSAVFDQAGRTMGRGTDNCLVLADPKNVVSQTQALFKSDGINHSVINLSYASPMHLNGVELTPDRDYALHIGDEMTVGLYKLRAEAAFSIVDHGISLSATEQAASDALHPELHLTAPVSTADHKNESEHSDDHQALMQAFFHGAGISVATLSSGASSAQLPKLTPELMETLGKLLATAVQGTIDLNALRTLVRREAHVDVTQVVVRNNNPLKFFSDAETVLTQMLRKKMPGFMGPNEAMHDAYEDLRAHQIGVVAGMRASMHQLLKRFNPELMQKGLTKIGLLDGIFPANRKAKLWDAYTTLFQKIHQQSQDDFQMLFGKAFLHTYEQEVDRLKQQAQPAQPAQQQAPKEPEAVDKFLPGQEQRHG